VSFRWRCLILAGSETACVPGGRGEADFSKFGVSDGGGCVRRERRGWLSSTPMVPDDEFDCERFQYLMHMW